MPAPGSKESVIDAEEVLDSNFPAELTRKVTNYLAEIEEVAFMFLEKGGSWQVHRWRYRPPKGQATTDDVCRLVCKAILADADKTTHTAYRVRLGLRGDEGKIYYRYCDVGVAPNSEGAFTVNDASPRDPDNDGRLEYLNQAAEAAIKSLDAVARAATGYANVGVALERVMASVAEVLAEFAKRNSQDVEIQFRFEELRQRGAALQYAHAERMDRNERISDFLDKLADPLADAIEEEVADYIRRKREERGETPTGKEEKEDKKSDRGSKFARELNRFFDRMSKEEREKFYAIFDENMLAIFIEAKKTETDEEFVALFMKLSGLLGEHYKDRGGATQFQKDIVAAIGIVHGAKLKKIIRDVRKKAGLKD